MSRKLTSLLLPAALVFLAVAAVPALGQNADQNSAGPTKNDLRLRVVEPVEGSTVIGSSVRVTLSNSLPRTTQQSSGTLNMPNPSFRVYLGNKLQGEIKRDDNVLVIENVAVGNQKLVVEALNSSGEVIDRKEVRFQTSAAAAPAAAAPPSSIPSAEANPAEPAPASVSAPAAPPAAPASVQSLPKTASNAPRAIVAGLALLVAGLLVSRKATV